MLSLFFDFYRYWYTEGLFKLLKYLKAYVLILADAFSVKVIFKTLLSPWRRDIVSLHGLPLDEKFKVIIMNLVSRVFGAVVKIITFAVFLVCFILLIVFELAVLLFWIFLPIITLELIVLGFMLMFTK